MTVKSTLSLVAIVPAAGVGSRMKADRPKQYLLINGKTVLEHTVLKLLSDPKIKMVVVAVGEDDPYFSSLAISKHPQVVRVAGGKERADSVLSGLNYVQHHSLSEWVLVHDAARPCVSLDDLNALYDIASQHDTGGILATPVRDTMKRANDLQNIDHTVERNQLWHALTPQMFRTDLLTHALSDALDKQVVITDEASAMERLGLTPALVHGSASNIKITQPEDLALAEFYLNRN